MLKAVKALTKDNNDTTKPQIKKYTLKNMPVVTPMPLDTEAQHHSVNPTAPKWDELEGELIAVKPATVVHDWNTPYGKDGALDVVLAELLVITGDKAGFIPCALVFPRRLFVQFERHIGEVIVGRVAKGVAKNGWQAPWEIHNPEPEDAATLADVEWPNESEPAWAGDFEEGVEW